MANECLQVSQTMTTEEADCGSRPIRVAMVRAGAWDKWVDTLADHLARNGCEVTAIVLTRDDEPSASSAIRIVREVMGPRFGGKLAGYLEAGRRLRRLLMQGDFDVVYVVDSWSIPSYWAATLGTLRWGRACVVYHTFEWLDPNVSAWWWRRMECALCRKADLVVNIDRVRGRAQQMVYRLSRSPLWVRNSLSRNHAVPPRSEARRRELLGEGAPGDAIVVLSPSVASPSRLGLELIEAVSGLPDRYRLAMIAGDGSYQDECASAAWSLGAGRRVSFLSRMPFDRLMEYVVCADVGAVLHDPSSPSFGDFLANPMRLSMFGASGVPVVAADLPTVAGEVYRWGLGVCCEPRDRVELGRAIVEAAGGRSGSAARKEAIRRTFVEEWCFESRAGNLVSELTNRVRG